MSPRQPALFGLDELLAYDLDDDEYEPEPEPCDEPLLLCGYARPATRRAAEFPIGRPITDLPPVDTYQPTRETRTP